jgi:RimJ/RimL family protein N-acetyltransferase
MKDTDFESLYQCASDPLIWEQHPQSNRYKREIFRSFFDSAIESGRAYVVLDKASGEVIGSSRYYDFQEFEQQVTIGYTFLARKYWGGSFNRELKYLMLDQAFEHVKTVIFEIGETNFRSQKAIEKIGAKFESARKLDDRIQYVYRLGKESYLASKAL